MEKRVKWKEGMEISPDVFILTDKYYQSETEEIGKIIARVRYGIVEGNISLEQDDERVIVSIQNLLALAANGVIVKIEGMHKEVSSNCEGYLAIRKKGFIESKVNEIPLEEPLYDFLCISDIADGDIIVGRMDEQELMKGYIPPCYLIGAHPGLLKMYERCINLLYSVKAKIKEQELKGDTTQLELLSIDLNNLGELESPKTLYMVMIKTVYCLHKLHPVSQTPIIPPFFDMDFAKSMVPILRYLEQYFHELDNVVKPVAIEPAEEKTVEKKYKFKI